MIYLKYIAQFILLLIIVKSTFHWIRTGFWVPKYIHFISIFMLITGGVLSYLAYSVKDANADKTIYLIIGFPLAVYIIYGLYGGGIHSKDIQINENLIIDRAMLKSEVVSLFIEHFAPYTKWNFENLVLLSARQHSSKINGKSGKIYLFELASELYEGEEEEKVVALYGRLTELKKRFYKPHSHIVYEIGKSGKVYRDGLSLSRDHVTI